VQLFLGGGGGDEGDVDAHLGHGDRDQVEGAAVDGGGGDDVVPALADVEQGQEVGGLPAGSQHGGGAPLQGRDLAGHGVAGGVLQAGIAVAVSLQVEQLAHILAGVVLEGGGLDDGDLAGFAVAGRIAALDADGIAVHRVAPFMLSPGHGRRRLWGGLFSQTLVAVGGDGGADGLEQLHQHDQQHHGHQHDAGLVAVVAVGDGHFAQAAAADGARHGRIAQNGGQGGGHAGNKAGHTLGDHHLGDDLQGGGAHAIDGLGFAVFPSPHAVPP